MKRLIDWGSKKQQSAMRSTLESKDMVAFHPVIKEAKWPRLLMSEFRQDDNYVNVFCGNAGYIAMASSMSRDYVAAEYIEPAFVPTSENVVDMSTKSLERVQFASLGVD
jgi:hypothetical protein